jgi:hypothetical protein
MSLAARTTPLIAAIEQLGLHDYLCSIYESAEEITRSRSHSCASGWIVVKDAFT